MSYNCLIIYGQAVEVPHLRYHRAFNGGPNLKLLAFHRDGLQFEVPADQQ